MNIGEMSRNNDGAVTGWIAEPGFDFEHVFLETVQSESERAPAFNLMTKSPHGRTVRLGSIWERAAKETGEIYFGGYLDSAGSGFVPIRLFQSRQQNHVWTVVRQPQRRRRAEADRVELDGRREAPASGSDRFARDQDDN